jgi:hypothetical protein
VDADLLCRRNLFSAAFWQLGVGLVSGPHEVGWVVA